MKNMVHAFYVLLSVTIVKTCSAIDPEHFYFDPPRHYCSKSLSTALSLVCAIHGGYNEQKRYVRTQGGGNQVYGIVDECCHKPCTMSTLALYCKTPKKNSVHKRSVNVFKSDKSRSFRDLASYRKKGTIPGERQRRHTRRKRWMLK